MLCSRCGKNNAEYYYSESHNGVKKTYALCGECALYIEAQSISAGQPPADESSLLSELLCDVFGAQKRQSGRGTAEKRCGVCGASFSDIAGAGKVGCAQCYRVFGEELGGTIRRIHGSAEYKGRSPVKVKAGAKASPSDDEISALKLRLEDAVKGEEYELAAQLRDKIRAMGADSKNDAPGMRGGKEGG